MGFDKVAYNHQYEREHYDCIRFNVTKGGRDVLQSLADEHTDGNMTALILKALKVVYAVDLRG